MTPSTMRALQMQGIEQLVEVCAPTPQPAADEVLVRTQAATICTSDLNDIARNPFGIKLPRILGHEGAGVVVAVGADVHDIRLGDRVAAHPVIPCRDCDACGRGLEHLCSCMGHLGIDRDGTFADFFAIRRDRLRRIPWGVDWSTAALLEPTAVCLEAVARGRVGAGDRVLVVGDGPFGLLIARLAQRRSPRQVIVAGRHEFRLRCGADAGAITVKESQSDDVEEAIRRATGGAGIDVAFLAVGSQAAFNACLSALAPRGRLVVFSALHDQAQVDMFRVHSKELEILGACNDDNLIDPALAMVSDSSLRLSELVTHRLPFDHWQEAFRLARLGKDEVLKVALVWSNAP